MNRRLAVLFALLLGPCGAAQASDEPPPWIKQSGQRVVRNVHDHPAGFYAARARQLLWGKR